MDAGDYNLKNNNLVRVYKYLYDHHEATKMELVYALHLSLPTVTQDLEELLVNGRIIVDAGKRAVTKTGRPAAADDLLALQSPVPEIRPLYRLAVPPHHL